MIRITVKKTLTTFALLQVVFSWGFAQTDSLEQKLEEVIVQENRILVPFAEQSKTIALVNKSQLETSPARSLQEVLAFVPGVDVRQRGIGGIQADIGIRGGSFDQTLMLLNGIKLSDPQTGHHMMNIPIPLINIERIEVLKGPGARIYGQNAYAGAINVLTKLGTQRSLRLQGFGGDFGMMGIALSGALPVGKYRQNLSISLDKSNGHWYNSDYQVQNYFYEGGVDLSANHSLRGMIAYTDRTFGANGFYTSSFPDQWESIQTALAGLSHTYTQRNLTLQTRAYWRRNDDEFRLRREEPSFFQNLHTAQTVALETNGSLKTKFGTTGLGLEIRKEDLQSTNLGDRSRNLAGIFLEQRYVWKEKLDLSAGIFSNYFQDWGWKHFPGAEIGYQVNKSFRLYTGLGKSFRIPTYTDLYYVGPTNIGNSDLQPEEAQTIEFGGKWLQDGMRAELVYFRRKTNNLIEWTRPNEETPWQPQNFNKVTFDGIEAAVSYRWTPSSQLIKVKEVQVSYNFIDATLLEQPGSQTRYSISALRHQLIGGLLLGIGTKFEWNTKMRHVDRMNQDPYFLLDMRIDYNRVGKAGLFAEASNITQVDYIEAGTVQMPGRWFRAGFMVNLD